MLAALVVGLVLGGLVVWLVMSARPARSQRSAQVIDLATARAARSRSRKAGRK